LLVLRQDAARGKGVDCRPSGFVCDECVWLCNDIIDDNEFSRLLEADEELGDRSYPAALEYLRGKSTDQLTRYVEGRQKGAERWRVELQQVKRMLAMRDDEVVPATDVLATPRFAFLKSRTKEDLLALQHKLDRRLKRYEDVQPIVATVVGERGQWTREADIQPSADSRHPQEAV
jgi:hypothetical protein